MNNGLDVIIVGAGLSGIGAAYYIQKNFPFFRYEVLESRETIGGTWDLFRYPGVRSDSDMYTLGYSFRPWKEAKAIADGPSILKYIKETAAEFGIDRNIRFNEKVTNVNWAADEANWTVNAENMKTGELRELHCRFLIVCCGYYDYEEGYTPDYAGISQYQGEFIHPQKWPQIGRERTDYSDKQIVVIGSGATAVTLVPELAKTAKHVMMLQRSPSYLVAIPSKDKIAEFMKKTLPPSIAHRLIRWKNILIGFLFYHYCRKFPGIARRSLLARVLKSVNENLKLEKDFNPSYGPWDQRVCFVPDGDFFKALNSGKAEIVTDSIESFLCDGIRLNSGRSLKADIIVSATGLKLKFLGGLKVNIDGKPINISQMVPYKGAMLSGVPNLWVAFGYTNASWTLKCDLICNWFTKVIEHMNRNQYKVVTPLNDPSSERIPLVDFSSGYFARAEALLPKQGKRAPWKVHQNYFLDLLEFRSGKLNDRTLQFS